MKFSGRVSFILSLAVLALSTRPATAQQVSQFLGSDIPPDLQRGEVASVLDRQHPELEPLGIEAGSMVLFPTLTSGLGYTTNVYGANTGAVADGFATIQPQVALISQWSRNYLELNGSADIQRYFNQSKRNQDAYSLRADGRIDLGTGDTIVGVLHRGRAYEDQYSGSFPQNAVGSVAYDQTDATVRGTFEFNKVRLIANGQINDLAFSDAETLTGRPLDEQYQNRTEYHSAVRTEYAFNPDIAVLAEASYVRSTYHVATAFQPLRSKNATRFLVGGNFDIGKLIRGTIGIGYEDDEYDLSYYSPIKGIVFDAQMQWLPTELTTVNFNATRKVEDASNQHSPGFFASIAQLRVDHELLRYVLLFAETTYEHDKFVALDRRDDQYLIRGGATYSLGRHFKLMPSFWYIVRNSAGASFGPIFKEQRGTIELFTQW